MTGDEYADQVERLEKVYELALRGLMDMNRDDDVSPRELRIYGEAFDDFAETIDAPLRIGDQTESVQQLWEDYLDGE